MAWTRTIVLTGLALVAVWAPSVAAAPEGAGDAADQWGAGLRGAAGSAVFVYGAGDGGAADEV